MFTGIIAYVGRVCGVAGSAGGKRLSIDLGPLAEGLSPGDSVAVSGACLTAATLDASVAGFDVIPETLSRTKLEHLRPGAKVNLERALRFGAGLEGHLVQGHVDGLAKVRSIRGGEGEHRIEFAAAKVLTDQMVPKGSVAIDGVSLTLAHVGPGVFAVALIPTTLSATTLADLRAGDEVNIETDVIGKYVLGYLQNLRGSNGGGITLEKLRETGFI